jgi:antitoxin (DNA-binding transcriptional repressor) of toxin-antitoxin stability system
MFPTDVVSITDLRTQTAKILDSLKTGAKYVFVNNKPQAVILSP